MGLRRGFEKTNLVAILSPIRSFASLKQRRHVMHSIRIQRVLKKHFLLDMIIGVVHLENLHKRRGWLATRLIIRENNPTTNFTIHASYGPINSRPAIIILHRFVSPTLK